MSLKKEAIELLQQLIIRPSFSRAEDNTAELIAQFFEKKSIPVHRQGNNVWVLSNNWQDEKPTILLNSHHDTVKPVTGWTRDPFASEIEGDHLFGLGSNDAGASLVALAACFLHFHSPTKMSRQAHKMELPYNMVFAATAEEEISGANGIASIIEQLPTIHLGIIGEPTQMQMAIAEKGLMVIDGIAHGKAGHAAREEGINALYIANEDITKIKNYNFERTSPLLSNTKATVTQINAGTQHNVVPDQCTFVIDVRTNELYSNEEVHQLLNNITTSELKARSFRLNSSKIEVEHPIVQSGLQLGMSYYGSPTLSDQALLKFPTIKIGVGKSERSHTANEFILISEIEDGIDSYIRLLDEYGKIVGSGQSSVAS